MSPLKGVELAPGRVALMTASSGVRGSARKLSATSPSSAAFDSRKNAILSQTHLRTNHFRGHIVAFSAVAPCIGTNAAHGRGGGAIGCLWMKWEGSVLVRPSTHDNKHDKLTSDWPCSDAVLAPETASPHVSVAAPL